MKKIDLNKFKANKKLRKLFVKEFRRVCDALGEILIEPIKDDLIFDRFESQGYWAGVIYKITYDEKDGFGYERRVFGR